MSPVLANAKRRLRPIFSFHKRGKIIDCGSQTTWRPTTGCCPPLGSIPCGGPIPSSKMLKRSPSRMSPFPITTFGSTRIKVSSTWSSKKTKSFIFYPHCHLPGVRGWLCASWLLFFPLFWRKYQRIRISSIDLSVSNDTAVAVCNCGTKDSISAEREDGMAIR